MSATSSAGKQENYNERSQLNQGFKHVYEATPLVKANNGADYASPTHRRPSDSALSLSKLLEGDSSLRFRLLVVEEELSTSGKVVCFLKQASLGTCGHYYSLSYTWGDAKILESMIVNGTEVQIPQRLEAFLKHARKFLYGLQLWIDAICIDQNSIEERNHQVSIMGQIYSRARKVLVWLGHENEDFAYLLTRLNLLQATDENLGLLKQLELQSVLHLIEGILQLPYWSRAWIVQELLLARNIELIYNEDMIAWDDFWEAVDKCIRCGRLNGRKFRHDIEFNFGHQHYRQRQILLNFDRPFTLTEVIANYEFTDCADIRDRVFAMLSLVKSGSHFKANYAWTPVQVVLNTYSHFGGGKAHLNRLFQVLNVSGEQLLNETSQERFQFHVDHRSTFVYSYIEDPVYPKSGFLDQYTLLETESTDPGCQSCRSRYRPCGFGFHIEICTYVFQLCVVNEALHLVCVRGKWNVPRSREFPESTEELLSVVPRYALLLLGPCGEILDEMEIPPPFYFQASIMSLLGLDDGPPGKTTVPLPLRFVVRLLDDLSEGEHVTHLLRRILGAMECSHELSNPIDRNKDQHMANFIREELETLHKRLKSEPITAARSPRPVKPEYSRSIWYPSRGLIDFQSDHYGYSRRREHVWTESIRQPLPYSREGSTV